MDVPFRLLAATFVIVLLPAHAADGIFCKGTMIFAERVDSSGKMIFGVSGVNDQSNIFSEQGVAKPHNGGWRYQVLSKENPEDHCTIDITSVDGGFSIHTFEGARCESSGGHNAYEVIMKTMFPATSRVRSVTHERDAGMNIMDVKCHPKLRRRKLR
ncbi:MAG: hypothetical protein ACREC9_00970 [Methylocella sp.]